MVLILEAELQLTILHFERRMTNAGVAIKFTSVTKLINRNQIF